MTKKKQAYNITLQQIGGNLRNLRYMTSVAIPGIYGILTHNYGLGRAPEVMDGMKDAMFDFICEELGGVEATFVSEEAIDWWTGLSDDYFTDLNWNGVSTPGNIHYKDEYEFNGPLFED